MKIKTLFVKFNAEIAYKDKLDIIDIVILNYLFQFAIHDNKQNNIQEVKNIEIWLTYKKMYDDLRCIGISMHTLQRRINVLQNKGYFEKKIKHTYQKHKGNYAVYILQIERFITLFALDQKNTNQDKTNSDASSQNGETLSPKWLDPLAKMARPSSQNGETNIINNNIYNNNINNNNINNIDKRNIKEKNKSLTAATVRTENAAVGVASAMPQQHENVIKITHMQIKEKKEVATKGNHNPRVVISSGVEGAGKGATTPIIDMQQQQNDNYGAAVKIKNTSIGGDIIFDFANQYFVASLDYIHEISKLYAVKIDLKKEFENMRMYLLTLALSPREQEKKNLKMKQFVASWLLRCVTAKRDKQRKTIKNNQYKSNQFGYMSLVNDDDVNNAQNVDVKVSSIKDLAKTLKKS